MVRVTLQALAAVLGGTQSLHTNGKDEALALPTAESAKTALRTQQIIAYESGVDGRRRSDGRLVLRRNADGRARSPRAGASLTRSTRMGGSIAAIESGWMQARIAESAYLAQQAIERGERVVVGVNRFAEDASGATIPLQRIDDRVEREQVERPAILSRGAGRRGGRTPSRRAFAAPRRAMRISCRISSMPSTAGVTLGEICNVLREVFGTYRSREVVA